MNEEFIIVGEGADAKLLPAGALTVEQLAGDGDLAAALKNMGDLGTWLTNYSKAGYTYNDYKGEKYYEGLARMVAGNYDDLAHGEHVKHGGPGPYIGGSPTFSNLRADKDGRVILDFAYGNNYEDSKRHHTGYIYSDDKGQTWNVVTNFNNPFAEGGDFYKWKDSPLKYKQDSEWNNASANQVIFFPTNKFRFDNRPGSAPYFEMDTRVKNRKRGYTAAQLGNMFSTYFNETDPLDDKSGYLPAFTFSNRIYTIAPPSKFRYGGRLDHSNFYKRGGRLNYFNIYGGKN